MRGGPLSQPNIIALLNPFVVTFWHGAGEAEMPDDVRQLFAGSELARDPNHTNVYMLVLDSAGRLVHAFHGLPGRGAGRSDYAAELRKALSKLKIPERPAPAQAAERPLSLPDLPPSSAGLPAGVRLFVRLNDERDPFRSNLPVIETVAMRPGEWNLLAFPKQPASIPAEALRSWLVQLYPAGIRTADQVKPFRKIDGALELLPVATADGASTALLRGDVALTKGGEQESSFAGTLEAVLTYRTRSAAVQSLRGIVEGIYMYRLRGTQRMPLKVAIESRPE